MTAYINKYLYLHWIVLNISYDRSDPTNSVPSAPTTDVARSFAICFDMEKMSNHSQTGEPMQSGSSLIVNIDGLGGQAGMKGNGILW